MTIADLLDVAENGAGTKLVEQLKKTKEAAPDLAPLVDPILAALTTDWTATNIANLLAGLPAEVLDILKGKLKPTPHAGDAA